MGVIQQKSLLSSINSLLDVIKQSHNPVMIRMLLSNLLYIHPTEAQYQTPLPLNDYVRICNSMHAYIQGEYKTSPACFMSNPTQGFLRVSVSIPISPLIFLDPFDPK